MLSRKARLSDRHDPCQSFKRAGCISGAKKELLGCAKEPLQARRVAASRATGVITVLCVDKINKTPTAILITKIKIKKTNRPNYREWEG